MASDSIAKLRWSKEQFKSEIESRISKGQELLNRDITSADGLEKAQQAFDTWRRTNEIFLENAFSSASEKDKYITKTKGVLRISALLAGRNRPTFQVQRSQFEDTVTSHLNHLKSYLEGVDYFETISSLFSAQTMGNSHEYFSRLATRFTESSKSLIDRRNGKSCISIDDEYDVQDLLLSHLRIQFEDVRSEEWNPSHAGSSARSDFIIMDEKVALEVKFVRTPQDQKKIKEEILVDVPQYRNHPDCDAIVVFVHDRHKNIKNPKGFVHDLENSTNEIPVRVYIIN